MTLVKVPGLRLAACLLLACAAAVAARAVPYAGVVKAGDGSKQPWIEQLSWHPRAYLYHHFLSDEECDHIIKASGHRLQAALRCASPLRHLHSCLRCPCCRSPAPTSSAPPLSTRMAASRTTRVRRGGPSCLDPAPPHAPPALRSPLERQPTGAARHRPPAPCPVMLPACLHRGAPPHPSCSAWPAFCPPRPQYERPGAPSCRVAMTRRCGPSSTAWPTGRTCLWRMQVLGGSCGCVGVCLRLERVPGRRWREKVGLQASQPTTSAVGRPRRLLDPAAAPACGVQLR
jgi:hypothetical protein